VQVAEIVALAEDIEEDGQPTPWAMVVSQWKKHNTVRDGAWVKRDELSEVIRKSGSEWILYTKDGKKVLGKFKSKEDAMKREKQIQYFKHKGESAKDDFWVTVEEMRKICPACADDMVKRGFTRLNLSEAILKEAVGMGGDFPGNMPEQMAKGLCDKFGGDPGFFTACEGSDLKLPAGYDRKAFCAELHKYCVGKWPAEESAKEAYYASGTALVPTGSALTFADLRAAKNAYEATEDMREIVEQFGVLAQNIIDSQAPDKSALLKALGQEFVTIVQGEVAAMQAEEPASPEEPATPETPEEPTTLELPPEEIEPEEQGARINAKMLTRLSDARKTLDEIIAWGGYAEKPAEETPKEEVPPEEETPAEEAFAESIDGACIALSEQEPLTEDGGRRAPVKLDVVLIKPGWGNKRDGHYYSKDMLSRDAHVFEGAKMYATDHRADEKSVRTEVSRIERIKGFTSDGAPIAEVTVFEPSFAEMVRNRADAKLLNTLECSILASGKAKSGEIDGVKGKIVESITSAQSVDWVTKAGAGGQALQLSEAAPADTAPQVEPAQPTEAAAQLSEEGKQNETVQEVQEAIKEDERPKEKEKEVLSEADINATLAKSVLPTWAQDWLREQQYQSADELEAAITRAIPRVKKATHSGEVFGQGGTSMRDAPQSLEEIEKRKKDKFNEVMRKYGAQEV